MRLRFRVLTLLTVLAGSGCDSNGPVITTAEEGPPFDVVFGTEHYDEGRALAIAADGDLLVAGAGNGIAAPADGTLPTPALARLDASGRVRWSRVYDELRYGTAVAVLEDARDRFVVLADHHDEFFNQPRLTLHRVDAGGRLIGRLYERPASRTAYGATRPLVRTRDGDFLLAAVDEAADRSPAPVIVRLSPAGGVRWTYAGEIGLTLSSLLETDDGGIVALGTLTPPPAAQPSVRLLRLDATGGLLWTKTLNHTNASALAPSADGGFVVTGAEVDGGSHDNMVVYVLNLDASGNTLWDHAHKLTDGRYHNTTRGFTRTPTGFAVTGWISFSAGLTEAFLLTVSTDGALQNVRRFGAGGETHWGYDVAAFPDGRVAITGAQGPDIPSFGGADFDTFVHAIAP